MHDAQADVPSARRLRAQLAFKDSMVHGILQFTPSIAFRYVLHRCESRDIRCRESLIIIVFANRTLPPPVRETEGVAARLNIDWSLAQPAPCFCSSLGSGRQGAAGARQDGRVKEQVLGSFGWEVSTMILPQVHLRKPCYDFSFL